MYGTSYQNICEGDEVALIERNSRSGQITRAQFGKVEKVTKTQFTALGRRWSKRTGREVGSSGYFAKYLQLDCDDLRREVEEKKAENAARRIIADYIERIKDARGDEAVAIAKALVELGLVKKDGPDQK